MTLGTIDASNTSDALGCVFTFPNNSFTIKKIRFSADTSGTTGVHFISISENVGGTITHPGGAGQVLFQAYSPYDTHLDGYIGYLDTSGGFAGSTGGGSGPVFNPGVWAPAIDGMKEIEFTGGMPVPAGCVVEIQALGATAYSTGSPTLVSPAYFCNMIIEVDVT